MLQKSDRKIIKSGLYKKIYNNEKKNMEMKTVIIIYIYIYIYISLVKI